MKERITLTLEVDLLNQIDKEMIRHQHNNKSRFIEFILRQVLYSPEQKFKLLEKSFMEAVRRQLAIADEKNRLQEWIEAKAKADRILDPVQEEKKEILEKDALWG